MASRIKSADQFTLFRCRLPMGAMLDYLPVQQFNAFFFGQYAGCSQGQIFVHGEAPAGAQGLALAGRHYAGGDHGVHFGGVKIGESRLFA